MVVGPLTRSDIPFTSLIFWLEGVDLLGLIIVVASGHMLSGAVGLSLR
jgi:hypothetical protein